MIYNEQTGYYECWRDRCDFESSSPNASHWCKVLGGQD